MFSEVVMEILRQRYLLPGETPKDMFQRVANFVGTDEQEKKDFFEMMSELEFLPNSPTLMNAGTKFPMLSACFSLPIIDTMQGIMKTLTDSVMIQKHGGGVGVNFSPLRPRGAPIQTTGGKSSGPVSFMKMFDTSISVVEQGGKRRGAMIGLLNYNHPDIEEFIQCKSNEGVFTNFNISVAVEEELFKSDSIDLVFNETVYNTIDSEGLLRLISYNAWKTGDPGMAFLDNVNKNNPLDEYIDSCNPCNEIYMTPYECCVLGTINLTKLVTDDIDWNRLEELVNLGITFLDNIIDIQFYPLPQNEEKQKRYRRLGLGIMGWADILETMDIEYDSNDALKLARKLMRFIHSRSIKRSEQLGEEKGYCEGLSRRNVAVNSLQPTGTVSMIAGCSSSIEPHYAKSYVKHTADGDVMYETNAKTALEISPEWHVKIQAAFQKYVDNSVSKTVNMPNNATPEQVYDTIILAHKMGCKGVTVYRDGSKRSQILRRPEVRPSVLPGVTHKGTSGCGSIYITVNKYNEDIFELFTNMGYGEGCAKMLIETLTKVMSKAIRAGVDPSFLVDSLCQSDCIKGKSCTKVIHDLLQNETVKVCKDGKCGI